VACDGGLPVLGTICDRLEALAPPALAESWDNVGLLAGDRSATVCRVMTCLTITPASAEEAVTRRADLVVSHHPLPFRPLQRVVTDTTVGRLLWQLLSHGVAIYSPHTAWDSTAGGINQQLAEGLALRDIVPLVPAADAPEIGSGRCGRLRDRLALRAVADRLKAFLALDRLQVVGDLEAPIERIAVACGAAGELLAPARQAGCQLLVLGETTFHSCLEAEATSLSLLLTGHFASERFAVEHLAARLAEVFPQLEVWASESEADPLAWY
jgi:dinuclear metal center YbgI/SA1388 family protein